MKLLLIGFLIAGVQQWAGSAAAPGCADPGKGKSVVVVKGDKVHAHTKCCDNPGKCKCKAKTEQCTCKHEGKKCKCHAKTGKGEGPGFVTITTSDDTGDPKVVVRKRCSTSGHGKEGIAEALMTAFGIGSDDGRSEPKVLFLGGDKEAKRGGWLGVSIDNVPEKLADKFDIQGEGVMITAVVGDSPADRAGLEVHDIILSIDDDKVKGDTARAVNLIKTRKPGHKTDIVVLRDGDKEKFTVKLGERGKGLAVSKEDHDDGRSEPKIAWVEKEKQKKAGKQGWLGVSIGNVAEELADEFDIKGEGVVVIGVADDGPAGKAGIRINDILLSVDDDEVTTDLGEAVNLITRHGPGEKVDIVVLRDGRKKEFAVKLGERESGLLAFGQENEDEEDEPELIWVGEEKQESKVREERGWLGVSIDNVPDALAAQLDIEGKGVIVVDVVEDSPADRSGLKVHDIILSVNDDEVKGDTGRAVNLIKNRKPGDDIKIVVLREGHKKVLDVELGLRPDELTWSWSMKSGERPLAELEEKILTRGKMLKKDKSGKWVVKDLGDLKELAELPENLKMLIPKAGKHSISITGGDDEHKRVSVSVERNGNVIVVEREDNGEITVTHVDEDGRKTKTVYEDEDELREADEEAYELYEKAGDAMVVQLDVDAITEDLSDLDFDVDTEDWEENIHDWRGQFEESFTEAQEAYEEAMKQFHEAMEQLKSHRNLPKDIEIPELPQFIKEKGGFPGWVGIPQPSKPDHTFEVRVDGTIEVRLRKGGSELVQLFEDENDLRDRSPKLYKKYKKLAEVEEE